MGRKSPKKPPEAIAFDKGVEAVIYMMDNLGINNGGTNDNFSS